MEGKEGQMKEVKVEKGQLQGMELVTEVGGVTVVIGQMVGVKVRAGQDQMEGDPIRIDKTAEVKVKRGQMLGVKVKALRDRMLEVRGEDRPVEGGMTQSSRVGVIMNT